MKICGAFGYDVFLKIMVANYSSRFFNCFIFILCINYFKHDFFVTCAISLNYATFCHHKKAMNVLSNGLFLLVEPL